MQKRGEAFFFISKEKILWHYWQEWMYLSFEWYCGNMSYHLVSQCLWRISILIRLRCIFVKTQRCEFGAYSFPITMWNLVGSTDAEPPARFQSDTSSEHFILTPNLADWRLNFHWCCFGRHQTFIRFLWPTLKISAKVCMNEDPEQFITWLNFGWFWPWSWHWIFVITGPWSLPWIFNG